MTRIKGYYVISFHAADVQSAQRNGAKNSISGTLFDMQTIEGFVPQDSVTAQRSLRVNIARLFTCGNNTVYKMPESSDYIKYYCRDVKLVNNIREVVPKRFSLENLVVPRCQSGEVYKIYYIDALWSKFQINNSPAERRLVGGIIATRCAASPSKKFTVVCCLNILSSKPYQVFRNGEFVKF